MSFHHFPATKSPRDFLRCEVSQSTVFHLCFLPLLFSRRMYIRQPSSDAFCLFLSPPDGQELFHDLRKASLKSWTSATIRQVARAPLYCSVGSNLMFLLLRNLVRDIYATPIRQLRHQGHVSPRMLLNSLIGALGIANYLDSKCNLWHLIPCRHPPLPASLRAYGASSTKAGAYCCFIYLRRNTQRADCC